MEEISVSLSLPPSPSLSLSLSLLLPLSLSLSLCLSACLCLCQAISNLHFSKSFLTNGKVNTLPWFPLAVLFFLLAPFCRFLYPFLFICRLRGNDEAVIYQWEIICIVQHSCLLVSDLGSVSLQAFMLCREISSLDSAFLLRRLPFFLYSLFSFPLQVTTGGRESQLAYLDGGIILGAETLFR